VTLGPIPAIPVPRFVSLVPLSGGNRCANPGPDSGSSSNTPSAKKAHSPLDTKPIEVYRVNTSMDIHTKWTGTRHKTREPIPGPERARPAVFTFRAPRSNVLTSCRAEAACLARSSRRSLTKAEVRRRRKRRVTHHVSRFTFHAIVTAELLIFYTFYPSHLKNTHLGPLPPNHLRKMPNKTVQFQVDFAPVVPRRHVPSPFGRGWGEGDLSFPSVAKGHWAPFQYANPPPTCANLCQPVPTCANLCQPVPT